MGSSRMIFGVAFLGAASATVQYILRDQNGHVLNFHHLDRVTGEKRKGELSFERWLDEHQGGEFTDYSTDRSHSFGTKIEFRHKEQRYVVSVAPGQPGALFAPQEYTDGTKFLNLEKWVIARHEDSAE